MKIISYKMIYYCKKLSDKAWNEFLTISLKIVHNYDFLKEKSSLQLIDECVNFIDYLKSFQKPI